MAACAAFNARGAMSALGAIRAFRAMSTLRAPALSACSASPFPASATSLRP